MCLSPPLSNHPPPSPHALAPPQGRREAKRLSSRRQPRTRHPRMMRDDLEHRAAMKVTGDAQSDAPATNVPQRGLSARATSATHLHRRSPRRGPASLRGNSSKPRLTPTHAQPPRPPHPTEPPPPARKPHHRRRYRGEGRASAARASHRPERSRPFFPALVTARLKPDECRPVRRPPSATRQATKPARGRTASPPNHRNKQEAKHIQKPIPLEFSPRSIASGTILM